MKNEQHADASRLLVNIWILDKIFQKDWNLDFLRSHPTKKFKGKKVNLAVFYQRLMKQLFVITQDDFNYQNEDLCRHQ